MTKKKAPPPARPASPFDLSGPSIFASDPHFRGASLRRGSRQTFGTVKRAHSWGDGNMGPLSAAGAKGNKERSATMTRDRLSIGPVPKRLAQGET